MQAESLRAHRAGDSTVCPSRLLDPANTQQFDDFKKCYGEILYRWGLREKRAEVLKFVSCPPDPHKGIGECLPCLVLSRQGHGSALGLGKVQAA